MIVFPNCKLNLGLHILRKRADGFHDLETVFYPLGLKDALEIIHSANASPVTFTISGTELDIQPKDNICLKAYDLLKRDFPTLPPIKMHLHKAIPSGAGLGGGSADGAFTLLLLNQKFQLGLTESQLLQYALVLGSDCPFFIINKPSLGTGRGENLIPLELDLSPYKIIIVNPGIHVPTGWAFSQLSPSAKRTAIKDIIHQPISEWKIALRNDFEGPIFLKYPAIAAIKSTLYEAGATYAAMSGTGSTVFGLFKKELTPTLSFPTDYLVKEIK